MSNAGAYGADSDVIDYILGITFEIWEEGGVDLIPQYYSDDCLIYGMDGIVRGSKVVVDGTRAMLDAFPDRLLLAEDVITAGSKADGLYSSHRILSPMTNLGATRFGPVTGRKIQLRNIADCFVEDGVITKEWLMRDNLAFVSQLGYDPIGCAQQLASEFTDETKQWFATEIDRLSRDSLVSSDATLEGDPENDPDGFARSVIAASWLGDDTHFQRLYSPYSVWHRSPVQLYSGRKNSWQAYQRWHAALSQRHASVDHVACRRRDDGTVQIAARWTLTGHHRSALHGIEATGKPVFVLGSTHWHCVAGRVAVESTVFDELAVISQIL
ncbi:MAG: ester cyclase [Pseudomonadota bacterium]